MYVPTCISCVDRSRVQINTQAPGVRVATPATTHIQTCLAEIPPSHQGGAMLPDKLGDPSCLSPSASSHLVCVAPAQCWPRKPQMEQSDHSHSISVALACALPEGPEMVLLHPQPHSPTGPSLMPSQGLPGPCPCDTDQPATRQPHGRP